MRDTSEHSQMSASDWPQAFAALPMETPPPGGFERLQSMIPAPRPQMRRRMWLAVAAVLVLAVGAPWQLALQGHVVPDPSSGSSTPGSNAAVLTAATGRQAAPVAAVSGNAIEPRATTRAVEADPGMAVTAPRAQLARSASTSPRSTNIAPELSRLGQAPVRAASTVRQATNLPDDQAIDSGNDATSSPELERLYAESAQLEALVALARNDAVASGTAASLAADLDAQVANIDAALVQPDIDLSQRTGLWHERIDALRQLASFESTQRMLASRGESYDAAFVRVD